MIAHHLPSIVTKIVACDNMYTIESKYEHLLILSFIKYSLLFVTNITRDLSKATKEIFVTNVVCN